MTAICLRNWSIVTSNMTRKSSCVCLCSSKLSNKTIGRGTTRTDEKCRSFAISVLASIHRCSSLLWWCNLCLFRNWLPCILYIIHSKYHCSAGIHKTLTVSALRNVIARRATTRMKLHERPTTPLDKRPDRNFTPQWPFRQRSERGLMKIKYWAGKP